MPDLRVQLHGREGILQTFEGSLCRSASKSGQDLVRDLWQGSIFGS